MENHPSPSPDEPGVPSKAVLWLRLAVAGFWAILVGALMALGANLLGSTQSEVAWVAVLGGAGAATYVFFFGSRARGRCHC